MAGLHKPTDLQVIEVARRFGLRPKSIKALAFAHFEQGFTRAEAAFLLPGRTTEATLWKYWNLWRKIRQSP